MEMDKNIYKVPKAVYFQCVWLVKDMERLKRLEAVAKVPRGDNELVFFMDDEEVIQDEAVIGQAKSKLHCIRKALFVLPPEYRETTLSSIAGNVPFADTAHINTWRRWRQIFIYELAKNLLLI